MTSKEGRAGVDDVVAKPLVLVVDDDAAVLRSVVSTLRSRFRVATAADGVEGLANATALLPDLIITDLMMPRMTGEELVREVRKREELAGIPMVLLTGYSDEEMRVRILRQGALDYITKPFYPRELLSRAENLVGLKRARELLERELDCRDRDLHAMADELVTRKHQLETALEAAQLERDRAARASEAKSDLLRLTSHELRTPVAALRLFAEQLERDRRTPLAQEHLGRVRRIIALADRISADIGSLLEHVRLDSGRVDLQADEVDLPALATEVLDQLRPQAEPKALELRTIVEPGVRPLRSDRRMLRIILENLAANAVKFTDAGAITVTVSQGEGTTRVGVRDTGPGIAPADQARVFEAFEQLEPVQNKHKPGLGLGLALARKAAAALGGRIELESALRQGSTFTLVVPDPAGVERESSDGGARLN